MHLHLISDSTGETIENIAKAALAQFDDVEVERHFWPMVRSTHHLDRIMKEITNCPGMIFHTIVNPDIRSRLENYIHRLSFPAVAPLDVVTDALSDMLGQKAQARPGRQHVLDAAYYARVEAIHYTIAHDDGVGAESWDEADIILTGVSRTSKTPTSIYLANRGYKTANIPIVPESPPPSILYELSRPLMIGLTTSVSRLVQIRRNRLLSLHELAESSSETRRETSYVENQSVQSELAFARRLFADKGWPVIDVTRRSIEETAAAIIRLYDERESKQAKL